MPKPILQQDVHSRLRDQIINWIRRPGEALREEQLAREFDVSRTPLREALRKLSEEGLVDYVPHKGARVTQLDGGVIRDVFLIREALEGITARAAALKASAVEVSSLRERFELLRARIADDDLTDVGDEIHDLMLAAADNPRLNRAVDGIMGQVEWLQHAASALPERLKRSFREHESILAAMEGRDAEAAEAATRAHVRSTLRDLLESLETARGAESKTA